MSWAGMALTALSPLGLIPTGYLFGLTLLSGRPKGPPPSRRPLRFDVIVPAHNEEAGIRRTIESLQAVDYPADQRRILVVADNCTDATADRAREAGAQVLVRHDAQKRGKGYALDFAFKRSIEDGFAEAVVVVDADSLVSPNLLRAFAARLDQGAAAVQAHYGVANPHASWRTRLMAIAFTLFHGVRSNARERLSLSCGLRGNGMCFTHGLLKQIPHDAFSVVEDVEYGIRLGRAGYRVHYAGEAEVLGEMVSSEKASRSQRERWEGGRWKLAREHGLPLLWEGLKKADPVRMDLAMDLLVPPLSYVGATVGAGLGAAVLISFVSGPSFALIPWGLSAAMLSAYIARGWWMSGMGLQGLLDLMRAPFYLAWKIALMVRRTGSKGDEWVRTARETEGAAPGPDGAA